MQPLQILIKTAYQNHAKLLFFTTLTVFLLKIIGLAPPLLLGEIVDSLNNQHSTIPNILALSTTGFVLAGIVQAIITPLQLYFLSKLVQQIIMIASVKWLADLIRKEFSQFSSWRIGHFIKSVERGITAHEQLLTFIITVGFPTLLEFLIVGIVFLYMGGSEIFFGMTGLGIFYLIATHKIIRWRRKHIDAVNEQEDELSAHLFNTLNAGKVIKLENAEPTALQPLNRALRSYATAAVTVTSSGGLLSGTKILFISISTGTLLGWGIFDQLSTQPSITVGQLVAIFSIAGSYLLNIAALTEGYRVLDQFLADQRRLHSLLSLPDFDHPDRQAKANFEETSTLTLRRCALKDTEKVRLSIVQTLTFTQCQSVAITGPSGAGKSTLLEVLAGLDESTRKKLSIDATPIWRLSSKTHLNTLRYCPQQPRFLEGPFHQSVLFGCEVSPDLPDAVKQLCLEEIVSLREITENASNISGGEAKRLSLLRLINRPGRFNLFDEPTASIEPEMAAPVWDLLFDRFAGRGLVCVTHDVSQLHRFDRVIVMNEGTIVGDGHWSDLVDTAAIKLISKGIEKPQ